MVSRLQPRWGGFTGPRLLLFWSVAIAIWLFSLNPAFASVHQYSEAGGQVMYRSLQTLRDQGDRAWQLVLFKRVKAGQVQMFHLRLTGFPGMVDINPTHLRITSSAGQDWTLPAVPVPYPANIGEYDVQTVMAQLDADVPLTLAIPLQGDDTTVIVPPFVVQEWRRLKDLSPS